MVHIGTVNGLRYLHCNLCESEWHVAGEVQQLRADPRSQLLVAGQRAGGGEGGEPRRPRHLPEDPLSGKDPQVEAVADDLASLVLDARMEEEGFGRSSINPFLFPAE